MSRKNRFGSSSGKNLALIILALILIYFLTKNSNFTNTENTSQLGQDRWVMSKFKKGFFLDVGCSHGIILSNTYQLELNGWKGICIDPFPRNFENRPNSIVVEAVLSDKKDKEVEFVIPGEEKEFAGIKDQLGLHKDKVLGQDNTKIVKLKTQLLGDILDQYNAPSFIEYFNIDIEGAELDVLSTFPFNKYSFGCITLEHNFEEPKRTLIREILNKNGYILEKSVEWDDWYVKK